MASPQSIPKKTESAEGIKNELRKALRRYLEEPASCSPYHESMQRIDRRIEKRSRK